VDIDVAIALDHLTLAATADNLGTCWIGAFSEASVKALLDIPHGGKVVAMTPLGYPASEDSLQTGTEAERKPPAALFSHNRYGNKLDAR
jgi:nitroreductase